MRYLKPAALVIGVVLWSVGLIDQFDSWELAARYMAISAAIVAVATV